MPFIPHTANDEKQMLSSIGVSSVEALFDEIPPQLRAGELDGIPQGVSEMTLMRQMNERARKDEIDLCFLGAGAYEHHIPAAVWDLASRGEFMTVYTPYQAEASQGTLQLIYEFQTMVTRLLKMDVANASVYDGASALAEAILMAVRANKKIKSRRVLVAGDLNPAYIKACEAIVRNQDIQLEILPFDDDSGCIASDVRPDDHAALVIAYPNFFGSLNDVNQLTDSAHETGALVIGVVNPTAMAILQPPGDWGETGADIAVCEGQPLGIPLSSGGPYLGIMCCRDKIVRQMPGRIIGRTTDLDGRDGFALTLQAREQHIRRGKATSNICTNQGLLVTVASIYMSLMGNKGLKSVAIQCHQGLMNLLDSVQEIDGVGTAFTGPNFHEAVLKLPVKAAPVLKAMLDQGILGGLDLGTVTPQLNDCLLVNVTETKTPSDLATYSDCLQQILGELA